MLSAEERKKRRKERAERSKQIEAIDADTWHGFVAKFHATLMNMSEEPTKLELEDIQSCLDWAAEQR